jgi:hypothetical protein
LDLTGSSKAYIAVANCFSDKVLLDASAALAMPSVELALIVEFSLWTS